ncbi:glycosyltransferase family 4 protein [Olivibacter sp. XZL3]|uniref:glycosyltransferase family 4 protein n=1 Tax=Olivibacter sp. XZL3 TaxID=1735116 RepID=UPI001066037C|nr:glycosyltransferase family 4 protein [Olivibacter sp. XZL3]
MKVAILAPIAWRSPPYKYGPWEQVASNLTEGLVRQGIAVTLFATGDSVTAAQLSYSAPRGYADDPTLDAKVEECLHISQVMEAANDFDIIHNHFDFLPLTYSKLIDRPILTTIHGFSSPKIIPVYKKYNGHCFYVSISDADRSPELDYVATVYNGINTAQFQFVNTPNMVYLLYFGRIHPEKGAHLAIEVARRAGMRLVMAGLIQDQAYFAKYIQPHLESKQVQYVGNVGPNERNRLLGNATALLHLIDFNEPFGLSVAEAMLCGTPVIAMNRGSMPELIRHGSTGFLVNSLEEAVKAVSHIGSLSREACFLWAKSQFTLEKMTADYLSVYRRMLNT